MADILKMVSVLMTLVISIIVLLMVLYVAAKIVTVAIFKGIKQAKGECNGGEKEKEEG